VKIHDRKTRLQWDKEKRYRLYSVNNPENALGKKTMPEPMFDATQVRHIKINNWRKQISSAIFYVRVMLGNKPGEMVVIISTVNETDVH